MDEEKGEELENELQLIYIFKAISELPHIFATLIKTVQHPYTLSLNMHVTYVLRFSLLPLY